MDIFGNGQEQPNPQVPPTPEEAAQAPQEAPVNEPQPVAQKPAGPGCSNCNNSGFEGGQAKATASLCHVCNGSPFGE